MWRKFRRLTNGERWHILRAIWLLGAMKLGLRLLGFNRLLRLLLKFSPAEITNVSDETAALARRTEWSIAVAGRYGLFSPSCLERSLLLWWLLRRERIDSQLRIGVRKDSGRFVAHAWIEYDRTVLNDHPDVGTQYAAFDGVIDASRMSFG